METKIKVLIYLVTIYSINILSQNQITIKQEFLIEDDRIGLVQGLDLDSNGNIYVGDLLSKKVYKYSKDGKFVQEIGNRGFGPGEFQSISGMKIWNDTLFVCDGAQQKITAFSLKNKPKYIYEIKLPLLEKGKLITGIGNERQGINIFWVIDNSSFVILYGSYSSSENLNKEKFIEAYLVSRDGKFIKTSPLFKILDREMIVVQSKNGFATAPMPYGRSGCLNTYNDNIFYANNNEDIIHIFDAKSNTERSLKVNIDRIFINPRLKENILDNLPDEILSILKKSKTPFPEYFPLIENFFVTKDRIWISTYTEEFKKLKWLIIDLSNKNRSELYLDSSIIFLKEKDNYLYGIKTVQFGLQQIVKYKIVNHK